MYRALRELENLLTQALVQARNGALTPDLLPLPQEGAAKPTDRQVVSTHPASSPEPLRTLDEVEAEHVQLVLDYTGGHKGKSCEILGISRPALDRKIKKYALVLP